MQSDYSSSFISSSARGTYHQSNPSYFYCYSRLPCHVAVHLLEKPNSKISLGKKTHCATALRMLSPPPFDGGDDYLGDTFETTNQTSSSLNTTNNYVFDANDWIEISKPENYIPYSDKLRQSRLKNTSPSNNSKSMGNEKGIVLLLLMALFVPIFSLEFFFALSRQFICGNYLTHIDDEMWLTDFDRAISSLKGVSPWATYLCSPHLDHVH